MAINKLSFVKFLELALTITCLGLHYASLYNDTTAEKQLLISGTFVGFTIILIALFAGYLMNTPINKRLDLFFSTIGCILFITSGAFIIEAWKDRGDSDARRHSLAKASLAIINGACFLFDVVFTFRE